MKNKLTKSIFQKKFYKRDTTFKIKSDWLTSLFVFKISLHF